MSKRIELAFSRLRGGNQKALITFLTAGDPDLETTRKTVLSMIAGGADLIELGVPFSDPVAEGPTIEGSSARALAGGTTTDDVFRLVEDLRPEVGDTPLLLMLYLNLVYRYGVERFMNRCKEAGVDGLIIPDLPLEELEEIQPEARRVGIPLIRLVAPTTGPERMSRIAQGAEGFLYCVSSMGVTGVRETISTDLSGFYGNLRGCTDLPLALGFGLRSREQIESMAGDWDGYIVGSAIVNVMAKEGKGSPEAVGRFVHELKGSD